MAGLKLHRKKSIAQLIGIACQSKASSRSALRLTGHGEGIQDVIPVTHPGLLNLKAEFLKVESNWEHT